MNNLTEEHHDQIYQEGSFSTLPAFFLDWHPDGVPIGGKLWEAVVTSEVLSSSVSLVTIVMSGS